jgi:hypothetical protein
MLFFAEELPDELLLLLLPHAASVAPAIRTVAPAVNNFVNFILLPLSFMRKLIKSLKLFISIYYQFLICKFFLIFSKYLSKEISLDATASRLINY